MHITAGFCGLLSAALLAAGSAPTGVSKTADPTAATTGGAEPTPIAGAPAIDTSFHLLYEMKFPEARDRLQAWEHSHPGDPVGPAAEAATYLFEEFYQQGVLTSEFFLNDKTFLGGIQGKPNAGRAADFAATIRRAQDLAQGELKTNSQDVNALFAMTISTGMQADYSCIIEKHQLQSLHEVRQAQNYAQRLLAVQPQAADAYLALGTANYVIGSMPAHTRFFLWFGGIHGDKVAGMKQLSETAERGHYLRPFAKLMLALADLREKQVAPARQELRELTVEFPQNLLFRRELVKLTPAPPIMESRP